MNKTEEWKYCDPNTSPSRKGLLLSNEIERFCNENLLIEAYDPDQIRPASYTLRVGPDYVDSDGKIQRMDEKQKSFYMEPNSIVYVSTVEELNLPYYIAARFNLRVDWVYRGILLGTGPQVDPGFMGHLSCPLFNLTNLPIRISLKEDFATIDFERTTDLSPNTPWQAIKDEVKSAEKHDEVTLGDQRYLLFKQRRFKPLQKLPPHQIVSSLVRLQEELKTWRNIGIAIVVAFLSLTLTLLNFQNNLYREARAQAQQIAEIEKKTSENQRRIDELALKAAQAPLPNQPVTQQKKQNVALPNQH